MKWEAPNLGRGYVTIVPLPVTQLYMGEAIALERSQVMMANKVIKARSFTVQTNYAPEIRFVDAQAKDAIKVS